MLDWDSDVPIKAGKNTFRMDKKVSMFDNLYDLFLGFVLVGGLAVIGILYWVLNS